MRTRGAPEAGGAPPGAISDRPAGWWYSFIWKTIQNAML